MDLEQPPPVNNGLPAMWDLVMADMKERDRVGRDRYGTPLQPHNGRHALKDAYAEILDLIVYFRQHIYEQEHPVTIDLDEVLPSYLHDPEADRTLGPVVHRLRPFRPHMHVDERLGFTEIILVDASIAWKPWGASGHYVELGHDMTNHRLVAIRIWDTVQTPDSSQAKKPA